MIQPSSVDLRLDRYFRVFQNHRYSHIDPAEEQDELSEGGLGIAIIRALTDDFSLAGADGGGSRLRFVKLLPA